MRTDIKDSERMVIFLTKLTDFNEHIKVQQMKEQIRMFGVAGEIFEDDFVEFLPKTLSLLQRLIKEEATIRLHGAIAEALGQLVFHIVDKMDTEIEQRELFQQQFLKFIFSLIEKSNNKLV